MSDDYFKRWSHSLLTRLNEQAAIAYSASMEAFFLREQLELLTRPDDRPLWRRIATQRIALRDEIRNRERAERTIQAAKAAAWDDAVATTLDHAVRNPDGITLRLDMLNPYLAGKDPVKE